MTTLETKIKQMLEKQSKTLSEAALGTAEADASTHSTAQTTLPNSTQGVGDLVNPAAGGSQIPNIEQLDDDAPGEDAAQKAPVATPLAAVGDAASVVVPSMAEDVSQLFAGQELSEDFRTKATELFEAAVTARVNHTVAGIKTKLDEQAEAKIVEIKGTLEDQVNSYMTFAVESWIKENAIAVKTGLRQEIAESFMGGLKNLFVESQLNVPDESVDVIAALAEANDALKAEHNATLEKLIESKEEAATRVEELKEQVQALEKAQIIESVSKGLTTLDAEKLKTLVEGVEFSSKELFAEKVSLIKNTHFGQSKGSSTSVVTLEESKKEVVSNGNINAYVTALKNIARK